MKGSNEKQENDIIMVVDFGSQYTHLIIKKLHELGVNCSLELHMKKLKDLHYKPKGELIE